MPLNFRAMLTDQGKPAIGPTAQSLGVRPGYDIPLEAGGVVRPGTGGMSVAPDWRKLPVFRIPVRLRHLFPRARGRDPRLRCWRMGDGPFADGPVADGLALRADPTNTDHGLVEPVTAMALSAYASVLAATRDIWKVIDEDVP